MKKLSLLFTLFWGFYFAWAHDVEVDGIFYNLNRADMTASVTYKGEYYFYEDYSGEVVIPATVSVDGITYSVTSLGNECFYQCCGMTSITIPRTITNFGNSCFYNCKSLSSITIPNSVTSVGDRCFSDCSSLTAIAVPNSVTYLGYSCFENCRSLTSITIPNTITRLESCCFSGCI